MLPDGASIWPTHGFGSFCTAAPAATDDSTLGQEKQTNPALRLAAEEFVTEALAGLDAYPAYYVHMGVANLAGPEPVDLRFLATPTPTNCVAGWRRANGWSTCATARPTSVRTWPAPSASVWTARCPPGWAG